MIKQIPNICTLANLFFGCIAIAFILHAPSYLTTVTGEDYSPILGKEQLVWGSVFILLAAVMDIFDGLIARALNVCSPIGRDLDSLADVVSFGVAPAMILFKLLWYAYMNEPGALDAPLIATTPAFLLACFSALRLARFNQTAHIQRKFFLGMPTPASGLIVASIPLTLWFPAKNFIPFDVIFTNKWFLYGIIALLCFLMVSNIKFLKWMAPQKGIKGWWPQLLLLLIIAVGMPILNFGILPIAFLFYIIVSVLYKYPETEEKSAVSMSS
jgi:CDP-diacylglycerol--serine O-phosphatidyltransferase